MKELNLKNITLSALVASCLLQVGAQMFAISIVARTLTEAPPRSFAMLTGEYGYNSAPFWNTVPMVTFVLFIIALVTNWKTQRRKLILFALTWFIIAGLIAGLYLEPAFEDMIKIGYIDQVDPVLQNKAMRWYYLDWTVWALGLLAGLTLLFAMIRPIKVPSQNAAFGKH